VYQISGALIEPHLYYLMINIAHPFDRCLRASMAIYGNVANIRAFSQLPHFMDRISRTLPSERFGSRSGGKPLNLGVERARCSLHGSNRPLREWFRGLFHPLPQSILGLAVE
jgi:hypothetical protein